MNIYERKAEKIIMMVYNIGGFIEIEKVLSKFDDSYIDDDVMRVLDLYGTTGSNVIDSKYGWTWYKLSEKGFQFARSGGFSGEKNRRLISLIGVIAVTIAAITGIVVLFL